MTEFYTVLDVGLVSSNDQKRRDAIYSKAVTDEKYVTHVTLHWDCECVGVLAQRRSCQLQSPPQLRSADSFHRRPCHCYTIDRESQLESVGTP